jgi:hypothetical protein
MSPCIRMRVWRWSRDSLLRARCGLWGPATLGPQLPQGWRGRHGAEGKARLPDRFHGFILSGANKVRSLLFGSAMPLLLHIRKGGAHECSSFAMHNIKIAYYSRCSFQRNVDGRDIQYELGIFICIELRRVVLFDVIYLREVTVGVEYWCQVLVSSTGVKYWRQVLESRHLLIRCRPPLLTLLNLTSRRPS